MNNTTNNMNAVAPASHVDKTDPQSILDDLSVKIRVPDACKNRVPPNSFNNKDGLVLEHATPLQLAHLLAFLNKNRYGAYVHIGRPSATFAIVNEYTRGVRADPHATIMCSPGLNVTLLEYSRHTFFKSTQISHTHDAFTKRLADSLNPGDLVTLDVSNDDVIGTVQAADVILQRGAQLVLFNIADPNHPNVAKVWRMMVDNRMLGSSEFLQSNDSVAVTGGGIGVTNLLKG